MSIAHIYYPPLNDPTVNDMKKTDASPVIRHNFRAENNGIEILNLQEITAAAMEGTIKSVILEAIKTASRKEDGYENRHPYMRFVRLFRNYRGMGGGPLSSKTIGNDRNRPQGEGAQGCQGPEGHG